jgi:hypothetical protein
MTQIFTRILNILQYKASANSVTATGFHSVRILVNITMSCCNHRFITPDLRSRPFEKCHFHHDSGSKDAGVLVTTTFARRITSSSSLKPIFKTFFTVPGGALLLPVSALPSPTAI